MKGYSDRKDYYIGTSNDSSSFAGTRIILKLLWFSAACRENDPYPDYLQINMGENWASSHLVCKANTRSYRIKDGTDPRVCLCPQTFGDLPGEHWPSPWEIFNFHWGNTSGRPPAWYFGLYQVTRFWL